MTAGRGDAQATLKITRSLNKDSGKINLNVELVSSRMLGICGVTLMKPDGTPVMGKKIELGLFCRFRRFPLLGMGLQAGTGRKGGDTGLGELHD